MHQNLRVEASGNRARPDHPFSESPAARWHVVATKSGREQYALVHLRNQGFETFLPMLRRTIRSGRRMVDRREAYFPGYLFLRLDGARASWRAVNSTRGVRRMITAGDQPLPLPPGFVEGLQAIADADGLVTPAHVLRAGDRVRILSGPFAELIGTLQQMESGGRISVLVEILNGEVPLTLDRARLAPAA